MRNLPNLIAGRRAVTTLAVPGGLAGQLNALAYAAWLSENKGLKVHIRFHDAGTAISGLKIRETLETPLAKSLGITFSQTAGWNPTALRLERDGERRRSLVHSVPAQWKESKPWIVARGAIRGARGELRALQGAEASLEHPTSPDEITRADLELSSPGAHLIGYPNDFSVVEEAWGLVKAMIQQSNVPDFVSSPGEDDSVSVHWRLGDYVGNPVHGAVSWGSIQNCLDYAAQGDIRIRVFTDSPKLAQAAIAANFPDHPFEIRSGDVWTDLLQMTESRVFVGTNSGVSILSALALHFGSSDSRIWLPNRWFFASGADANFRPPTNTIKHSALYPASLVTHKLPA